MDDGRLTTAGVPARPDGDPSEQLRRVRHSCAHLLAEAVIEYVGDAGEVKLGIGPPTREGFYYDFLLPRPLADEELARIEKMMKGYVRAGRAFTRSVISPEDANRRFADQPFKLELIEGILRGAVDDNGDPLPEDQQPELSTYQQGSFVDLCQGPHVETSEEIEPRAIKLLKVAGAYWRGDEKRPMLQRIYGTAWLSEEELKDFLWRQEEALKRDHRRLGRELELFHIDETAPGMPYWLPNGLRVLNGLLAFWREEHEVRGYQEIATPLVNDSALWEKSGHWDHFKENMFVIPVDEEQTYALKPMNCPNAMVVFNLKPRSYRDLPLRLSDCDVLHRNERSGTLHGLLRVRRMQQDDAHIFLTPDQIEAEYDAIFDICDRFYNVFELTYQLRLGTRPAEYLGEAETWDAAEGSLRRILDRRVGAGNYEVEEGGGAFYGPKIDIVMVDALKRPWQMGTIQLDFQLPRRFDCTYADADGSRRTPVVVHRVIYGSLERFLGILIEHTSGAFPLWLAPVQVAIVPVQDAHDEYARTVAEALTASRFRVETYAADASLGARIRKARLARTPIIAVVGDRERDAKTVTVRARGNKNATSMTLDELVVRVGEAVASHDYGLERFAEVD